MLHQLWGLHTLICPESRNRAPSHTTVHPDSQQGWSRQDEAHQSSRAGAHGRNFILARVTGSTSGCSMRHRPPKMRGAPTTRNRPRRSG